MKSEIVLERSNCVPGDVLKGFIRWISGKSPTKVRLIWFTSGKGTVDTKEVGTLPVSISQVAPEQVFEFQLPGEPYSFSGKLISLHWAVELDKDKSSRVEFTLSPNGQEIHLPNLGPTL